MQLSKSEADILARLEVMPFDVWEDEIPDGKSVTKNSAGDILPYVSVFFGEATPTESGRGIVSVVDDPKRAFCTVQCSAIRSKDTRDLRDLVVTLLEGFRPFDSGEMSIMGGVRYRAASTEIMPTMYIREVAFGYITNNTRPS